MNAVTAETIIREALCDYHGDEDGSWDVLAEELVHELTAAGFLNADRYELVDPGVNQPWTAFAHWSENGQEHTKVIGAALYVRCSSGGAS